MVSGPRLMRLFARTVRLVLAVFLIAASAAAFDLLAERGAASDSPEGSSLRVPYVEPSRAVETMRLLDGFRVELLAAEPLVTDPVAIAYDEDGRLWVAEMGDYPYSDKKFDVPYDDSHSLPLGRVRVLEDLDGDGRFDRSTVFAEDLSWPTGIAFWKGGVFVASTPDILYLKDTDGDLKADVRQIVFTGFRKFNIQAVVNNLAWGLDHWIYAGGSENGGKIVPGDQPDARGVEIRRRDFRFDPVRGTFETLTGGARFGNSFDDWGNRYTCNNRRPVQQAVLEDRYLTRNPNLAIPTGLHNVADEGVVEVRRASPPEPWRVITAARNAATADLSTPTSEKVATGYLTSASGVTAYRGAAYPSEYYGNFFVGDPASNVVLRYTVRPDGVTFRAEQQHAAYEFLASTDIWCRPVNFCNAPDGTLHIADMYREVIEHPGAIPDDVKAELDMRSGHDRGRIYKLVPPRYRDGFVPPPRPQLGAATTAQLVQELENPNSWWRDTAHRLIYERQDQSAVEPLRTMLHKSPNPLARLHALWSLEGLSAVTDDELIKVLSDETPEVREHAVRIAESRMEASDRLFDAVLEKTSDRSIRVRFQTALTLGASRRPEVAAGLMTIARQDAANKWVRSAILSSLSSAPSEFLELVLIDSEFARTPGGLAIVEQLAHAIGRGGDEGDVRRILQLVAAENLSVDVQHAVLVGIGQGLRRSRLTLRDLASPGAPEGRLIHGLFGQALETARSRETAAADRVRAIDLLGIDSFASVREPLSKLLDARESPEIQSQVVRTFSEFNDPAVAELLLAKYPSLTPATRLEIVQALDVQEEDRVGALLDAIEGGTVSVALISPARRTQLQHSPESTVQERARKLFGSDMPRARDSVIADYQGALKLTGDVERGRAVFRRECASCHRLGAEGNEVGPNLSTVRHRTINELLVNVLDPNREVAPNYLEFIVATADGRVFTGLIASETATSITLGAADHKEQTVLKSEIEEITDSRKSLMPEGLEQKISPQDMADVLTFVLKSPLSTP